MVFFVDNQVFFYFILEVNDVFIYLSGNEESYANAQVPYCNLIIAIGLYL